MEKWEYQTHLSYKTKDFEEGIKDRIRICEMGEEGWELAFIIPPTFQPDRLVFKRPAQLPSDIVFTSDLKKTTEDNVPGGLA